MIDLREDEKRELEVLFLQMELWRRERDRCIAEHEKVTASINEIVMAVSSRNNIAPEELIPVFDGFRFLGFKTKSS